MPELIDPLLQLRSDWRQATAITVPAVAAEAVPLLDRALDLLDERDQLNEPSLTMAIDLVCNAVPGRSDEVDLLRIRLSRAAHDYATTVNVRGGGYDDSDLSAGAFEDEEALAAALFAVGDGTFQLDERPAAATPAPAPSIDRRTLQRQLSNRPSVGRRIYQWGRVVVLAALVGAGLLWVLNHPPSFLVQREEAQGPATTQAPLSSGRSGSFQSGVASCPGGTDSPGHDACIWPLVITSDGQVKLTLSWTPPSSALQLEVIDASTGKPIGAPATGPNGQATFTAPVKAGATYQVIVTNSGHTQAPIAFTLSQG